MTVKDLLRMGFEIDRQESLTGASFYLSHQCAGLCVVSDSVSIENLEDFDKHGVRDYMGYNVNVSLIGTDLNLTSHEVSTLSRIINQINNKNELENGQ